MPAITVNIGQTIYPNGIGLVGGQIQTYKPEYPVPFDPTVTQVYRVNRIHVELPVYMEENFGPEIKTGVNEQIVLFATEAETNNFTSNAGGFTQINFRENKRGPNEPLEQVRETAARKKEGPSFAKVTITTEVKRSIMPITIDVIAQLVGPEGVVWSAVFPVTMSWVTGQSGSGSIDLYADLVNPLIIYSSQNYTLRFKVFAATTLDTNTQIGLYLNEANEVRVGKAFVTFYYSADDRYSKGGRK